MKTLEKLLQVKEMIIQQVAYKDAYPYFKENYKMVAIDLSRQNELDADPRAI